MKQDDRSPTRSRQTRLRLRTVSLAAAASVLLAACGTTGPNPALEDARRTVDSTATNALVTQRAPLELKAATDTLARADRIWRDDGNTEEVEHLAYVARQQSAIALAQAQAREADEQIKTARSEADRLRLQTRTQQLSAAQAEVQQARQQTAAAQAQAQNLQQRIQELEAQQTERGLLVTLGDVLFEFGKSDLLASAAPRMDKLADFLNQYPDRKVLIEGYTDSVGSESFNQRLSEQRAAAIERALVQRGIDRSRFTLRGYGKNYPVASNANAEGRALNRRVEVVIADENGNLRSR